MRVITFSRVFPAYHPRKGAPTFFMERIWKILKTENRRDGEYSIWATEPRKMVDGHWQLPHLWRDQLSDSDFHAKYHTIRAGNRWKAGDMFSPRVWSGKPYASKQIEFAPPIEIKNVWDFELETKEDYRCILINGKAIHEWNSKLMTNPGVFETLARNDGLTVDDMVAWFDKPFTGQIICWNESIQY